MLHFSIAAATLSCDPLASSCVGLSLGVYVVQSLTMLGVLVTINFSVTTLRGVLGDYPQWADEAALYMESVYGYAWLRSAVLAFLLAPTVFFIVQLTQLSWRQDWTNSLLGEGLAISAALAMCLRFKPVAITSVAHAMAHAASKAVAIGPTEERVVEAAVGGAEWERISKLRHQSRAMSSRNVLSQRELRPEVLGRNDSADATVSDSSRQLIG